MALQKFSEVAKDGCCPKCGPMDQMVTEPKAGAPPAGALGLRDGA